ncbi:pSer/pThr/pTyr-binding forkhead associated (FHA) protein [Prosthecobacter fusiformis]|uniref:PSer/pThr/pTyr-binding forkhead associated (FHA) protein n=1 Tax=Prosthecobacter fusiformis TaxID=48464 RepID=A0A4R7RYQ0_9BACT|nr:adenylate/guanylate cyclase domain-containing protein [Prosthecobacter fusiformis]TDU70981.1 pSer/pThr/pTyr-binding forkhead associated (FHA) protein [Prosthecobacter fusiformis]
MPAFLRAHDKGVEHSLEDFTLLGRSPDATIRLTDAGVSRQHATIRRDGSLYWVSDLGSANGSFVNDVAVTTARALRHGDRIQLGTCIFIFETDEGDNAQGAGSGTQMLHTVALPMRTVRATLLVGDLRNFTNISARLSAEQVATMLREWYADCERILKPRGAIIDKFIGDGVFAYWVGDSIEMREQATEAARLLSSPEASESPVRKMMRDEMDMEVYCHVGLNIGGVALGAMGRGVNTAVGEAVNVTFRIESLTRKLQVPVLAGSSFLEGWADGMKDYKNVGIHAVKGQPEPVEVYALVESNPVME